MEQKQRVKKGEPYWFVDIDGRAWDRYERNEVMDSVLFDTGNYFHTKGEAERMCKKFLAVLKGADVIEMPSEEEMLEARPTFPMEYDPWDAKNIREGFESCYEWLKEKIVK